MQNQNFGPPQQQGGQNFGQPQQQQQQFGGGQPEKKLFGNAKQINTQYGAMFGLGFNATELQEMLNIANANGGWCNLTLKQGRSNWYMEHRPPQPPQPQQNQGGFQQQQQPQQQPQQQFGGQQQQQFGQPQQPVSGGFSQQSNSGNNMF